MRTILFAGVLFALGQSLATDYTRATSLRIESTSEFTIGSTMSVEVDGQPVEGPRGGGESTTTEKRSVVQIDQYLAHADGKPTHVRRTFEAIDSEGSSQRGDRTLDMVREAPLEDVTLDITVDEDGEVSVEVAEGSAPDAEFLEGHQPLLALDGLLPAGEVAEKDTWELDGDAIQRALGADVAAVLFPRPEPPDVGGDGERGGGRRRGGFGLGGGGVRMELFRTGEWKGEATLESLSEDHEGTTCAAITIEIEGSGELPEPEMGGGGRGGFASGAPARAAGENEFEIEAKGRLLYSLADGRPIHFELEGKMAYESRTERSGERGTFVITSSNEGTFTHGVQITEAKSE